MQSHSTNQSDLEQCAELCHECADACLRLIPHCLTLGGSHASASHINMLIDCAAICTTSHSFLHRRSPLHEHTCRACASICASCAEDCERFAQGDSHMSGCADQCRRCAEACRSMVH